MKWSEREKGYLSQNVSSGYRKVKKLRERINDEIQGYKREISFLEGINSRTDNSLQKMLRLIYEDYLREKKNGFFYQQPETEEQFKDFTFTCQYQESTDLEEQLAYYKAVLKYVVRNREGKSITEKEKMDFFQRFDYNLEEAIEDQSIPDLERITKMLKTELKSRRKKN